MHRRLPLILFVLTAGLVSGVAVSSADAGPAQFNPDPVAFGGQQVNTTSTVQTVTITNSGTTDMTVDGAGLTKDPSSANPGDFSLTNDTCPGATLTAGGGTSCSADVTFTPSSVGGESMQLDIATDAPSSPYAVQVTGNGTPAPVATLSAPGSVDVGNQKVGTSSSTSVHVTNSGNATLSITTISASDTTTGAGFGTAASVPSACVGMAPGDACDIPVSFAPTIAGALTGVLSISSNDPLSPTAVSLTGTGTVPQASVDASVSFATPRNVPQTKAVTLTNTGNAELDVDHATLNGDATFTNPGTGNCGNAHLQPGDSCSAQVTFLPTTAGTSNATVTFTDDDGSVTGSTQVVALQGNALLPNIQATPASVSFPDVALGRVTDVTHVMITNSGAADLTVSSLHLGGSAPGAFLLGKQTCIGPTIAPGGTCRVNLRFAPSKLGGRLATLVVANDAGPDLSVGLGGNGVAPADGSNLRSATSCEAVRLTWRPPDATGFSSMVLVRNARRYPRNPGDGVRVRHRTGVANDTAPRQFHTYRYALFAMYRSYNHARTFGSPGLRIKVHLGRICRPRDGGVISDLTPKVDWTKYAGTTSYAFILQRGSSTLLVRYPRKSFYQFARRWTYRHSQRSLAKGGTYHFYLYAYTRRHRNGLIIGHTTWTER
jgi:Abnormal spindle-like microcephaly-assoc'd, ASPM-SPD-2-Hydin